MTPENVEHALAALSARQMALESLLAAVIAHATIDRPAALSDFDAAAAQVRDQYLGLPLGEAVLDLVEQSYAELRALL
jgi:hypothetical protein